MSLVCTQVQDKFHDVASGDGIASIRAKYATNKNIPVIKVPEIHASNFECESRAEQKESASLPLTILSENKLTCHRANNGGRPRGEGGGMRRVQDGREEKETDSA